MNVCMSRAAGAEKIWDYIWCSQPLGGDRNAPARGGVTDVRKRTPPWERWSPRARVPWERASVTERAGSRTPNEPGRGRDQSLPYLRATRDSTLIMG